MGREFRQSCFLESDIVIIIDHIDADHGLATGEQRGANMIADEAGRAGDEYHHIFATPFNG